MWVYLQVRQIVWSTDEVRHYNKDVTVVIFTDALAIVELEETRERGSEPKIAVGHVATKGTDRQTDRHLLSSLHRYLSLCCSISCACNVVYLSLVLLNFASVSHDFPRTTVLTTRCSSFRRRFVAYHPPPFSLFLSLSLSLWLSLGLFAVRLPRFSFSLPFVLSPSPLGDSNK